MKAVVQVAADARQLLAQAAKGGECCMQFAAEHHYGICPAAVHWSRIGQVSGQHSRVTAAVLMQNERAEAGTSFMSVQRVPTTTLALKQAVTNQPVVVGVDASDWSAVYTSVSPLHS